MIRQKQCREAKDPEVPGLLQSSFSSAKLRRVPVFCWLLLPEAIKTEKYITKNRSGANLIVLDYDEKYRFIAHNYYGETTLLFSGV